MPQGPKYEVYDDIRLYNTAADAIARRNDKGYLTPTGLGGGASGSFYIDNYSGWDAYWPAVPIWFIPSAGPPGYNIGWVNDDDNGFPLYVGHGGAPRRAKALYVGDANNIPKKAKGLFVGNAQGVPKKAR